MDGGAARTVECGETRQRREVGPEQVWWQQLFVAVVPSAIVVGLACWQPKEKARFGAIWG